MTPPSATLNDLIQIEHQYRRQQVIQSWSVYPSRQHPKPANPPMRFVLHWHDAARWPLPKSL